MTRRRWIILGVVFLVLTIGAELYVRPWTPSRACVQICNGGDAAMDDLVVVYGETKVRAGRLGAGETTNVWFSAAGKGPVILEFNQNGNPMNGLQIPDFDASDSIANGFKLVLTVKKDEIERYMDDDLTRTPIKNLFDSIMDWFRADLSLPR